MNKNKLSFKVLLDSYNTSSFTGTQFNASYYVDFKRYIVNNEDLDKSYYVYASFESMGNIQSSNEITNENLYLLSINFNKGNNIIQYATPSRPVKNICYIIPVDESYERGVAATGSVATYTRFRLKDKQQMPTVVKNIRSINAINLQVIVAGTNATIPVTYPNNIFTPTTPNNSKYTCILTFLEI